jgi:hypothetical protein
MECCAGWVGGSGWTTPTARRPALSRHHSPFSVRRSHIAGVQSPPTVPSSVLSELVPSFSSVLSASGLFVLLVPTSGWREDGWHTKLSLRQAIILPHVSRSLARHGQASAGGGAYLALAFFFVCWKVHFAGEGELPRPPEHGGLRCHGGRRTEERAKASSYTGESWEGREF